MKPNRTKKAKRVKGWAVIKNEQFLRAICLEADADCACRVMTQWCVPIFATRAEAFRFKSFNPSEILVPVEITYKLPKKKR